MTLATLSAIILGTSGCLILGMAALIKGMLLGRLESIQTALEDMTHEIHQIDLRVTRLETEHQMGRCNRRADD